MIKYKFNLGDRIINKNGNKGFVRGIVQNLKLKETRYLINLDNTKVGESGISPKMEQIYYRTKPCGYGGYEFIFDSFHENDLCFYYKESELSDLKPQWTFYYRNYNYFLKNPNNLKDIKIILVKRFNWWDSLTIVRLKFRNISIGPSFMFRGVSDNNNYCGYSYEYCAKNDGKYVIEGLNLPKKFNLNLIEKHPASIIIK